MSPLKMYPVNDPWIRYHPHRICVVYVQSITMKLEGEISISFFLIDGPCMSFHTIDDNVLANTMRTICVVLMCFGIIANVCNIDLPGNRIFL